MLEEYKITTKLSLTNCYVAFYHLPYRLLCWEMARPTISIATINELFGPGLQPGADCGMNAEEMAGVIHLLEKDDSDVAVGAAMDELLHKIMPAESIPKILPTSEDDTTPSAEEIRNWCRKHLLDLKRDKPQMLATLRKALAEMQGVVVDVRYFFFIAINNFCVFKLNIVVKLLFQSRGIGFTWLQHSQV